MVEPLIDKVEHRINKGRDVLGFFPIFEADKGYDAEHLREKLVNRKIFPWMCRRRTPGHVAEKVISTIERWRWKVERAISWLQRKCRRLVARWERKTNYWKGLLSLSLVGFWISRLVR